jgi:hypothetical protein
MGQRDGRRAVGKHVQERRLAARRDGEHERRSRRAAMLEFRMSVVECDVPSGSALSRELIERAYFRDSYRAPLTRSELGIVDIFFRSAARISRVPLPASRPCAFRWFRLARAAMPTMRPTRS